MRRRAVVVFVSCGALALALGGVLLLVGTEHSPGSAGAAGAFGASGSAVSDQGGGGEAAASGAERAIDHGLFNPGACVAFPPTSGDRHQTVFLDAGHGGIDPGGVGSTEAGATVEESTVNLAIELDAMAILRSQGYSVVVSRTENTTVTRLTAGDVDGSLLTTQGVFNDVSARDVCANMAGASVLVGIYMDSGEPWNAGCLTGYDQDRPFSGDNLRLATLLQDDVLGAMNAHGWDIPDEGVQSDTGLGSALTAQAEAYGHLLLLGPAQAGYFETPSQMPGALIEPLFVTDPFEASIAASAQGQHVIASALARAIEQYLT
ncbi:MAG TPA: N-acetylmuramoyl-L-alanine amidase [Trebonia sp.]|nr:N-acetylmuramoyl-L-alanine amidase [Trebonia sp.]